MRRPTKRPSKAGLFPLCHFFCLSSSLCLSHTNNYPNNSPTDCTSLMALSSVADCTGQRRFGIVRRTCVYAHASVDSSSCCSPLGCTASASPHREATDLYPRGVRPPLTAPPGHCPILMGTA